MKQIQLTRGYRALVDDEDFELLAQRKWWPVTKKKKRVVYATTYTVDADGKRHFLYMHRFILGINNPVIHIDHRDGDGLNNQRSNIRLATRQQNSQYQRKRLGCTSSKFKGVHWIKSLQKWRVSILIEKQQKYFGFYKDEEEAARAHDRAAILHFGEFARLNFPKDMAQK